MKKEEKQTIFFNNKPYIIGYYSIVGPKEGKGTLGEYFSEVSDDDFFGQKTYEKAERTMLEKALKGAVDNAGVSYDDIKLFLSGDLLNQIISSSYAARTINIPYVGVFGACSTMAESLALGSCLVDGGHFETVACATSSHFSTAERQFRFPLELGNQRPPTAQWTVTGSGADIISSKGKGPRIISATFGKVVDFGISDVNNMGAAMAPAIAIIGLCGMILPRISNTKIYSKGGKYSINNVCEIQVGSQQNILLTFYYRIKIQIIWHK